MDIDPQKLDDLIGAMEKLSVSFDALATRMESERKASEEEYKTRESSAAERDALAALGQKTLETNDTLILRDIRDAVQQINSKIKTTQT